MKWILGAIAFLLLFVSSIAVAVWWQLSHNFVNVSCSNFIYQNRHLFQCATWSKGCGIVEGITIPAIAIGILGIIGCSLGYGFTHTDV